jgi:hypothetical protein
MSAHSTFFVVIGKLSQHSQGLLNNFNGASFLPTDFVKLWLISEYNNYNSNKIYKRVHPILYVPTNHLFINIVHRYVHMRHLNKLVI